MDRISRALWVLLALLCVWHGMSSALRMRHVGEIQAVFSPAMAEAVAESNGAKLAFRIAKPGERWIYQRLTHDIPSYRGVAIGDSVHLAEDGAPADYLIEPDGRLTPLR